MPVVSPASQIHSRMHHLLSLLFLSPLSVLLFLMLSTSVPVLVFVVPAVEVYVERHDAAGRHASDQSPAGRAHKKVVNQTAHTHTHTTYLFFLALQFINHCIFSGHYSMFGENNCPVTQDSLLSQVPQQQYSLRQTVSESALPLVM